jgi:hypothetical protein
LFYAKYWNKFALRSMKIVKFLLILVAFYLGASIIAGLARKGASRVKNASQLLVNFLGKFVKQAIMLVDVYQEPNQSAE